MHTRLCSYFGGSYRAFLKMRWNRKEKVNIHLTCWGEGLQSHTYLLEEAMHRGPCWPSTWLRGGRECKAPPTLCPGRYPGWYLQWTARRDEVTSPPRQSAGLLRKRKITQAQCFSLITQPTARSGIHHEPFMSHLWDLEVWEIDARKHEALATAFAMSNEVLCLWLESSVSPASIHEIVTG